MGSTAFLMMTTPKSRINVEINNSKAVEKSKDSKTSKNPEIYA